MFSAFDLGLGLELGLELGLRDQALSREGLREVVLRL